MGRATTTAGRVLCRCHIQGEKQYSMLESLLAIRGSQTMTAHIFAKNLSPVRRGDVRQDIGELRFWEVVEDFFKQFAEIVNVCSSRLRVANSVDKFFALVFT